MNRLVKPLAIVLCATLLSCGDVASQESAPNRSNDGARNSASLQSALTQPSSTDVDAQGPRPERRRGRGPLGRGARRGRGFGRRAGHREDMSTIHAMFDNRDKINRTVKELPNGAEATTESNDPKVAALIQSHVPAMESRVQEDNPLPPMTFHPVFQQLIRHADDYTFDCEYTDKGVKVTYTAEDPFVVMLVREHAKLVSRFIKDGMQVIHAPYRLPQPPPSDDSTKAARDGSVNRLPSEGEIAHDSADESRAPTIDGHGRVVRLPDAAGQPRAGSKICVDVTQGGPRDTINPAIEKVARYVNIYSGAGRTPATVRISVILHGDATLVALKNDVYAQRFNTSDNPNLPLMDQLRAAGVELLVCGQALALRDVAEDEVADQVDVAVSGLTVNVNRQQDGYAYIPLH